ncbi:MAG: lipoyl synthase [Candidatus Aminicenantales bacterium]
MTNHPPDPVESSRKPDWLKVKFPSQEEYFAVSALLRKHGLHTICRSAQCPNRTACWSEKTATFLILGEVCTRNCAFCAVSKGTPAPPSPDEPAQVAEAAAALGLKYAVITSVTRDDLADGGAAHFAAVIGALRARIPGVLVETLVPDFQGAAGPLALVLEAGPDILNHNLETVESFYPRIGRPAANYRRSLGVLRRAKDMGATTKSGLMIGLGEAEDEMRRTLHDLRQAGCDLLTIGQYLRPTRTHAPVAKYHTPDEFRRWRDEALLLGFRDAETGPLVRSSFHAHKLYETLAAAQDTPCAT